MVILQLGGKALVRPALPLSLQSAAQAVQPVNTRVNQADTQADTRQAEMTPKTFPVFYLKI